MVPSVIICFYEQVKSAGGLEDLYKFEKSTDESPNLTVVNNVEEKENGKEEVAGWICLSRQNDDGKTNKDKKPSGTIVRNAVESPVQVNGESLKDDGRVMVYICGGYKGEKILITHIHLITH